jgi:probable HAF family extracellular repeat protein
MRSGLVTKLFGATVLFSLFSPAHSQNYNFTTLNLPGYADANGINASGQIVGYYTDGSGQNHGFLYSGGSFTSLNDPSAGPSGYGNGTFATGISDQGQIVGNYYLGGAQTGAGSHGFLYGGSYTNFNHPAGVSGTYPTGINASGQIVGTYSNNGGYSFLYSSGTYTPISDPLGDSGTFVSGINNLGQIVGSYDVCCGGPTHGFLYSGGTYTTIDDPLAIYATYALGINNLGQIVGLYGNASGKPHGFLYSNGVYTTVDDPLGLGGTVLTGINDAGQISGYYYDQPWAPGLEHTAYGFLATPAVPEPSTWAMMIVGFLGLGFVAYRKKATLHLA